MIYIDSIFKTTDYDFTLITATVIDEFKKDYPAQRCLISRKDHKVVILLFRNRTGIVTHRWIITHDTDLFHFLESSF